eukprot:3020830-Pyramimonas_sp.AAC.1
MGGCIQDLDHRVVADLGRLNERWRFTRDEEKGWCPRDSALLAARLGGYHAPPASSPRPDSSLPGGGSSRDPRAFWND